MPIVPVVLGGRVVLLLCLPNDHRSVSAQAVRDLWRVPRIVFPAIEYDPNLCIAGEGLYEMGVEVSLASRDHDQPSLTCLPIRVMEARVREGLHVIRA